MVHFAPESLAQFAPDLVAQFDRNIQSISPDYTVFPNLYAFIDAPAGAGKGILNFVRFLAAPIHKAKREETKRLQEEYEQKVNSQRKEKEQTETTIPPPPSKMLLIPFCRLAMGGLFSTKVSSEN